MSPYLTPFVQVGYLDRNFDAPRNRSGVDRIRDLRCDVGMGFALDPALTGEIAAGVFRTISDDSTLDRHQPAREGTLTWDVTRLTTITGAVSTP